MTDEGDRSRDAERAWQHPWLRINLLLRQMTKAFSVRETRPIFKTEFTKALRMRAEMKRAGWWN